MQNHTLQVSTQVYHNSDARNWLAVHNCVLSPTKLGQLEIVFTSAAAVTEFSLRFGHLVTCTQSTT